VLSILPLEVPVLEADAAATHLQADVLLHASYQANLLELQASSRTSSCSMKSIITHGIVSLKPSKYDAY
jgi:hypothetical protein